MKRFITLAMSAVLTMGIGVTAFGACKNGYATKYYVPSFSYCSISGEDMEESLSKCLDCLKNCGYNCSFDYGCINNNWQDCTKPENGGGNTQIPDSGNNESGGSTDTEDKNDTEAPTDTEDTEDNEDNEDKNESNVIVSSNQTQEEAAFAAEVVRLVNEERAAYGLSALKQNSTIQSAAQVRSYEQVKSFSHTRPDGRSCFTALEEAGVSYRGAGENIAYGQKTPSEVVKAWMNSEGHRANILSKNFTDIGVGCYISQSGTIYWTQLFTY